nr:hypothetical protein [Rhodovastum atsumiense]
MQPDHLLVAKTTVVASVRPQALLARRLSRFSLRWNGDFFGDSVCGPTDSTTTPINSTLQGFAEITEEVPPIRDLQCIRCALPYAVGIGAGAVTRDNLDSIVAP